uniref:ZnMc domain-containing protein n=1 Tax=Heterorhabditis bacteriophora TaxID=37862 RepID=A0A1I7XJT5_HETBA
MLTISCFSLLFTLATSEQRSKQAALGEHNSLSMNNIADRVHLEPYSYNHFKSNGLSEKSALFHLNERYGFTRWDLVKVEGDDQVPIRRTKRYVVRKKRWRKNMLTWRLNTRNINEGDMYIARNTLHRAFYEWSTVSAVQFVEVEKDADIVVGFEKGKHEDAFPFDGKDGVVAHAFYPRDGRLHFDADEEWTLNSASGVNLFQTAVHEIGHLLGLEHSVDPRAAMYAAKRPYDPDFTLGIN